MRYVIDLFGLSEKSAREKYPWLFQHLVDYVLPERRANNDKGFRERWWLFGRPRPELRQANHFLRRYIVTSEVAKHRVFGFLNWPDDLVDGSITAIVVGRCLGARRIVESYSRCLGVDRRGTHGRHDDPRYQNGPCFDPFPFPKAAPEFIAWIRGIGESLESHRRRQQAVHPKLAVTDMYNVLEKLRRGGGTNGEGSANTRAGFGVGVEGDT